MRAGRFRKFLFHVYIRPVSFEPRNSARAQPRLLPAPRQPGRPLRRHWPTRRVGCWHGLPTSFTRVTGSETGTANPGQDARACFGCNGASDVLGSNSCAGRGSSFPGLEPYLPTLTQLLHAPCQLKSLPSQVTRAGLPAETNIHAFQVPDRPSPPVRADDKVSGAVCVTDPPLPFAFTDGRARPCS